ncbi:hypothetical protein [Helicobacter burdigaliensis]|uniref:hypothetical protein n=1 Tax=Helicobacter burdigaliensis TaxID=2315334 RepID=UPI000EF6CB5E|nr:hypothetical protein [Helicobacter burdigaliensis]
MKELIVKLFGAFILCILGISFSACVRLLEPILYIPDAPGLMANYLNAKGAKSVCDGIDTLLQKDKNEEALLKASKIMGYTKEELIGILKKANAKYQTYHKGTLSYFRLKYNLAYLLENYQKEPELLHKILQENYFLEESEAKIIAKEGAISKKEEEILRQKGYFLDNLALNSKNLEEARKSQATYTTNNPIKKMIQVRLKPKGKSSFREREFEILFEANTENLLELKNAKSIKIHFEFHNPNYIHPDSLMDNFVDTPSVYCKINKDYEKMLYEYPMLFSIQTQPLGENEILVLYLF